MWRCSSLVVVIALAACSRGECVIVDESGTGGELVPLVRETAARFRGQLDDFRCDFPVYLRSTHGELDGAGRVVDGKPSLVLDAEMIHQLHTAEQLPVFLTHEMFHRYHFAMAGFSDDDSASQPLWRTLWAEGLATYASAVMNPTRPLSDAWLLPADLDAQVQLLLGVLARTMVAQFESVDPATFRALFTWHTPVPGEPPPRAGYYVGYRVAAELAKMGSLRELAHWDAERVKAEMGRVLAGW